MALESPVDPQEEIDSGSDDEGASLSQSVEEAATQAAAQAQVGVLSPCPLLKTWGQGPVVDWKLTYSTALGHWSHLRTSMSAELAYSVIHH